MEKLIELGKQFGLEGKDLLQFISELQEQESEQRAWEFRKLEVQSREREASLCRAGV